MAGALIALLVAGAAITAPPSPAKVPLTVLALGDSYTIGEGVRVAERWPMILAERLRADGIDVADPQIIAETGWTTDDLLHAIDREGPAGPFGLVTLLIGVNDQYRGGDLRDYLRDFEKVLARAIALAGDDPRRVVVVSIPDWGVSPFAKGRDNAAIRAEIDGFNAVNRKITRALGARYVDVTTISRNAMSEGFTSDGLHPSAKMYRAWVDVIAAESKQIVIPASG